MIEQNEDRFSFGVLRTTDFEELDLECQLFNRFNDIAQNKFSNHRNDEHSRSLC